MESDKIRELIANGKTGKALEELLVFFKDSEADFSDQVNLLSGRLRENQRSFNLGIIDPDKYFQTNSQISYATLDIVKQATDIFKTVKQEISGSTISGNNKFSKKVFISYNHKDMEIANKIRDALVEKNIEVIIDSDPNSIGKDIKTFIENSVRNSEVTLSIISKNSLISAWVAMESINTFYNEKTNPFKKFIACIVENNFHDRSFTDDALDTIDNEISSIRELVKNRMEKGRGIGDLQNELKRFTDLQNNLDEIVRRLKESAYVEISGNNLSDNIDKIYKAIIN